MYNISAEVREVQAMMRLSCIVLVAAHVFIMQEGGGGWTVNLTTQGLHVRITLP